MPAMADSVLFQTHQRARRRATDGSPVPGLKHQQPGSSASNSQDHKSSTTSSVSVHPPANPVKVSPAASRTGSCSRSSAAIATANTNGCRLQSGAYDMGYNIDGQAGADVQRSPSSSTAGATANPSTGSSASFSRKRKCDTLDDAASLPRHGITTLATPLSGRPRSATCSSAPSRYVLRYRVRTGSTSTASLTGKSAGAAPATVERHDGLQKHDRQQNLQVLQPAAGSLSTSSSVVAPSPSPSLSLHSLKRLRLDSEASLPTAPDHLASRHSLERRLSSSNANAVAVTHPPRLDTAALRLRHGDLCSSGPPSASSTFANTQPHSPAYAAVSLTTPSPPCPPSPSSPLPNSIAQAHREISCWPSNSSRSPFPLPLARSNTHNAAAQRTFVGPHRARERIASSDSVVPVRQRLRRSTSLPLEDELSLSRSSRASRRPSQRASTSAAAFNRNTLVPGVRSSQADSPYRRVIPAAFSSLRPIQHTRSSSLANIHAPYHLGPMVGSTKHRSSISEGVPQEARLLAPLRYSTAQSSSKLSSVNNASTILLGSDAVPLKSREVRAANAKQKWAPLSSHDLALMHRLLSVHDFHRARTAPATLWIESVGEEDLAGARLSIVDKLAQGRDIAAIHQESSRSSARDYASFIPWSWLLETHIQKDPHLYRHCKQFLPCVPSVPSFTPPIAKSTLKELDLNDILKCRQLRHDVVFDSSLMFRPNYDGVRGDRKREAADRYWHAITRELESGCRCTTYPYPPSATARLLGKLYSPLPCICNTGSNTSHSWRLSQRLPSRIEPLIRELRGILLALLPLTDNDANAAAATKTDGSKTNKPAGGAVTIAMVNDALDAELIAQQIAHVIYDVASLASFLGRVLKAHCAPMRDEAIDHMVQVIQLGGEKKDMKAVSSGLRECFTVLELMKLDIANHHLRMLRPFLCETAAEFESKSFMRLLERRKQAAMIDDKANLMMEHDGLAVSRTWFKQAAGRITLSGSSTDADGKVLLPLTDGTLEMLFKPICAEGVEERPSSRPKRTAALPEAISIPETFQLDIFRLQLFHRDVVDLSVLHLLLLLYRQLCSKRKRAPTTEDITALRSQIWIVMSDINNGVDDAGSGKRSSSPIPPDIRKLNSEAWRDGMKDILLQIAHHSRGQSEDTASSIPDQATLSLLDSWADTHLKAESKLFQLVQARLRKGLERLIYRDLQSLIRSESKNWDLSATEPVCDPTEASSAIIKENGLTDLSSEVRLLASRIAKVVGFNARAFWQVYTDML